MPPAAAHAIPVCTAAQVVNNDTANCPNNSNPCNISKTFEINDGCTLDFGTRSVTVLGSGKIDVLSNSANIRAGTFSVAPSGRVEGRGNLATPPRDRGGSLTITTTGAVNIQRSGSIRGIVDFSANTRAGTFIVIAGGNLTVSGDVIANNLTVNGGNGVISLRSGGNITTGSLSAIAAMGGDFSTGGFIDFTANGTVDLGATVNANGGDGGVIDVASGGEAIVRGINATGGGDAGSGGCASVIAGTRVQMLGPVVLNGTGSPTQSGGGCGGFIDIEARFGDATVSFPISAESGAPDGGGGGISVIARGSVTQAAAAPLSVQGQGPASCGGEISLEADLDVFASGALNASGGFGGNLVDLIAGRNVALNGMVDARGRDAGGFGGSATVIAGDRGLGNVSIGSTVDVGGGLCGTLNGCGLGGFTEVSGCNVTVASGAVISAEGADGGDNLLVAREKLTVQGLVDATTSGAGVNGTNVFQFPSRVAPTIVAGNVTPPAVNQSLATCAAVGQTACLVPCPTCGNGMVEFPETCDQSGNTANCDGCSSFCRTQSCNDANVCTADACDATLGCRNDAVSDTTSCTDNNVCNGVERCSSGVCRASTPPLNCNDNNQCSTDACNPTLGCQNPASPINTPCNDGNACTSPDVCNGSKVCSGPPVCGTTTTSTLPVPTTTSSTVPLPTTTSTTSPVPTTTSTTSPVPTTTSTSVPGGTTSSTTVPQPTTTSTSVPGATTSSTSLPSPTTTSTSTPGPSTTSTTLATGCVPVDCSDGNACTTDSCQAGTCVHRREGFDAVTCELAKLTAGSLCGSDPVHVKLAKAFVTKGTLARNLVGKAENNTKTAQKLLNRAVKQLNGLRKKVAKVGDRGKISPSCGATLDALLAERLSLVQGLSTP